MKAKKYTFKNGLRLLSAPIKGPTSVTIMIAAAAGSRYEDKHENGLSHFMEHMFFKGGGRYKNALAVSSAIDCKGGIFNAYTGNEAVIYFVKLASKHIETACDVLADMILNSKFKTKEINKERGVIIEEINMYKDKPDYQVAEDFNYLLYGNHPLGRSIVGLKKSIRSFRHKDFIKYKKDFYAPDNIIISMAGDISHNKARLLTKKYFRFPANKKIRNYQPFVFKQPKSRISMHVKKTEQAHLLLGGFGYNLFHPLRYAAGIMATILGGGMSSRMFTEIREKRGLCYYVHTHTSYNQDCGDFATMAGVNIEHVELAIREIVKQCNKIAKTGVTASELRKAKDLVLGHLALNYENSYVVASAFACQELLEKKITSIEEDAKKIEIVTAAQIKKVAKELFRKDNLYLAIIGPFKKTDKARFSKLLAAE